MAGRGLCLALALVVSSCASAIQTGSQPSSTAVPPATTTTFTTTSTTPSTTEAEPVLGLITATGIAVAVIDQSVGGFLVMTPCGFEAEVTGGEALGPTTVVLDPGHGGPVDTGAIGQNGVPEKQVNLDVAERAAGFLTERGIDVVLTRTSDYTSPLFVRANLADTLGASLMVSIHHNAPTPGPSELPGVEIFIQHDSDESARLGGLLWEHTRRALDTFDVPWTAAPDAGVMTVINSRGADAYGIIRHPETPTALVELGYMSNPPEAELFATPVYHRVAGLALAEAIEEYLETDSPGSGFVEGRVFNPRPGVGQDVCTDPDLGRSSGGDE